MPRTVSASEAKTRFGSMVKWAIESEDEVIVESHGEPKVVIMPFEEYRRVVRLRDQYRRQKTLDRLEQLKESIQARNPDLSAEQADSLADRFIREVIGEMVDEGRIKYQD